MHDLIHFFTHLQFGQLHLTHLSQLRLGAKELLLLKVLVDARGRVVSRTELRRRVGLRSDRRCDDLLVNVRQAVGPDVVQNVRSRGWRVDPSALTADT
jgi:DNA-binding winged helix-turn-helix (wHTH) protein